MFLEPTARGPLSCYSQAGSYFCKLDKAEKDCQRQKHSSLIQQGINYDQKSMKTVFTVWQTGVCAKKLFYGRSQFFIVIS